jgi:hypothetical protein
MFELSFMISATLQARPNGWVSVMVKPPPTASERGQLYIWPKLLMMPLSIAIATVNGLKVEPSS